VFLRWIHKAEIGHFLYYYYYYDDDKARIGNMRNSYTILFEKPEGKRPLGKLRVSWENSIKIGLEKMW
jgi:hypothetical protein